MTIFFCFLLLLLLCSARARVALSIYVDPESPQRGNGSMAAPFQSVAEAAAAMPPMGGVVDDVVVQLAARLYTGDANCYQVFALMTSDTFQLRGDGAWAGNKSLPMATFTCVQNVTDLPPRQAARALWLGLFLSQSNLVVADVTFRDSVQFCNEVWLEYEADPTLTCPGADKTRVASKVCGGVAISVGPGEPGVLGNVTLLRVRFESNVITRVDESGLSVRHKPFHALMSPLNIMARGLIYICDSVFIIQSTFFNNTVVLTAAVSDITLGSAAGQRPVWAGTGGGAVNGYGGSYYAIDSTFEANRIGYPPAAVQQLGVRLKANMVFFEVAAGGAILLQRVESLTTRGCVFASNSATGVSAVGGAIAMGGDMIATGMFDTIRTRTLCWLIATRMVGNAVGVPFWGNTSLDPSIAPLMSTHMAVGAALFVGVVPHNSTFPMSGGPVEILDSLIADNVHVTEFFAAISGASEQMDADHICGGTTFSDIVTVRNSSFVGNSARCRRASGGAVAATSFFLFSSSFVNSSAAFVEGQYFLQRDGGGGVVSTTLSTDLTGQRCIPGKSHVSLCEFDGAGGAGAASEVAGLAIFSSNLCPVTKLYLSDSTFRRFAAVRSVIELVAIAQIVVLRLTLKDNEGGVLLSSGNILDVAAVNLTNATLTLTPAIQLSAQRLLLRNSSLTDVRGVLAGALVVRAADLDISYVSIDGASCTDVTCAAAGLSLVVASRNASQNLADVTIERAVGRRALSVALDHSKPRDVHGVGQLAASRFSIANSTVGVVIGFSDADFLFAGPHLQFAFVDVLHNSIERAVCSIESDDVTRENRTDGEANHWTLLNNTATGDSFAIVESSRRHISMVLKGFDVRSNVGLSVAAPGSGDVTFVVGKFFNNTAGSTPLFGAFDSLGGLKLTNATFDSNEGALLLVSAEAAATRELRVLLLDVDIVRHRCAVGSAISIAGSNTVLRMDRTSIRESQSAEAFMSVTGAQVQLASVLFEHNTATNELACGGALFLGASQINGSVVLRNNTAPFGGALCVASDAPLAVVMSGNVATSLGSDAYVLQGEFQCPDGAECASVAHRVELLGLEGGAMVGLPTAVSFALLDKFGQPLAANMANADVNMVRYALYVAADSAGANCSVDAPQKVLCVIDRSASRCSATVTIFGAQGSVCDVVARAEPIVGATTPVAFLAIGNTTTLRARVSVQLTACAAGYGESSSGNASACVVCSSGTYNVDARDQACHPCGAGLFCDGSKQVASLADFWSVVLRDGTVQALPCDADVCLPGVPGDSAQLNKCAPGRNGTLCASCSGGANETPVSPRNGRTCVACDGVNFGLVAAIVLAVAALSFVLHVSVVGTSARTKILFFYVQTTAIVVPRSGLRLVFAAFDFKPQSGSAAFGGFCLAPLNGFTSTMMQMSYPLLLASTLSLIFAVRYGAVWIWARCRARPAEPVLLLDGGESVRADGGDDDGEASGVPLVVSSSVVSAASTTSATVAAPLFSWHRLQRSLLSFVLLSFSVVLSAALKLVSCIDVGDSLSVLAADPRLECSRNGVVDPLFARYQSVAYALFLYVSLVVVLLPVVTWRRHVRPHAAMWRNRVLWSFLSDGYRVHWWENVVLVRRLVLGVLGALLPVGDVRSQALLGANLVALAAHTQARPFAHAADNSAETLSLVALTFNCGAFGHGLFADEGFGFYFSTFCLLAPAVVIAGSIAYDKLMSARLVVQRLRSGTLSSRTI